MNLLNRYEHGHFKVKKIINFKTSKKETVRIFILTLLIVGFTVHLNGQIYGDQDTKKTSPDFIPENVRIYQDENIEAIVNQFLQEERSKSGIIGFRIRIYSDSGQGAGENAKSENAKFMSLFPRMRSYIKFDSPYYRVYVGNFRTRSEANKLLNRIEYHFPSAFIVKTRIGYID